MKAHKYLSPIGLQYYWYGDFYIRLQHATHPSILPPYALIQSSQTVNTEREFDELKERNALEPLSEKGFHAAYNEAKSIMDALTKTHITMKSFAQKRNETNDPWLKLYYEVLSRYHTHNYDLAIEQMSDPMRVIVEACTKSPSQEPINIPALEALGFYTVGYTTRLTGSKFLELCWRSDEGKMRLQTLGSGFTETLTMTHMAQVKDFIRTFKFIENGTLP